MAFIHRLPLFVLSPVLAIIISVCSFASLEFFSARQARLERLSHTYAQALSDAKANLATHVHSAAAILRDGQLAPGSAVQAQFETQLRHGEFNQVELYSATGCELLAKASLDKNIPNACPTAHSLSRLFWQQNRLGIATLGMALQVLAKPESTAEATSYWLVGQVALDQAWLQAHPSLDAQVMDLRAVVAASEPPGGAALLAKEGLVPVGFSQEGLSGQDSWVASLWTQHWLLQYLAPYSTALVQSARVSAWLFLALAFLLSSLSVLVWWGRQRLAKEKKKCFFLWCQDLMNGQTQAKQVKNAWEALLFADPEYEGYCLALQKSRDSEWETYQNFLQKFKNLQQESQRLELENLNSKERLANIQEHASLAHQVRRNALELVDMSELQHTALEFLLAEKLNPFIADVAKLRGLLECWEVGLSSMGSRKFIRSLCETPGDGGGEHLLAEQLDALLGLSKNLAAASQYFSHKLQGISEENAQTAKVLGYWYALAKVVRGGKAQGSRLQHILSTVEALYQTEQRQQNTAFSLAQGQEKIVLPLLPGPVWVACFYHMWGFCTEGLAIKANKAKLVVKEKSYHQQRYLSLSCIGEAAEAKNSVFSPSPYHWHILKNLLSPYNVGLTYVPGASLGVTVTLSWVQEDVVQEETGAEGLRPRKLPVALRPDVGLHLS